MPGPSTIAVIPVVAPDLSAIEVEKKGKKEEDGEEVATPEKK